MIPARIHARAALLALALCAAACGGGSVSAPPSGTIASVTAPPFLSLVPDAPERVEHTGRRRITYDFEVGGFLQRLQYEEDVAADGQGHYAILPVAVTEPPMTQPQREIFLEIQRARQSFFFKYRDPRIRNLSLFLENHSVELLPATTPIAGVDCAEILVRAQGSAKALSRLAIDPQTGLVLRSIEFDELDRPVTTIEFLSLAYAPPSPATQYFTEPYPGTPLATASLAAGIHPVTPQVLPAGFRELSADTFTFQQSQYIRRVYGNGIENLFLLQKRSLGPNGQPLPLEISGQGTVRVAQVGPWRMAELIQGPRSIFLLGKITESEVLQILQSAF